MSKENKYDTDPLDAGLVRETDEIFAATREISRAPKPEPSRQGDLTEEPTRRFYEPPTSAYPSAFVSPVYQPPPAVVSNPNLSANYSNKLDKHRLPKLGLPENVASGLAYAPFFVGLIVSLAELLLLPRSEARTRNHAAQALSLHFLVLIVGIVFKGAQFLAGLALGNFSLGMLGFFSGLFAFVAIVFLIISMVRVLRGEDIRYPQVADMTKWINQHLEPMK